MQDTWPTVSVDPLDAGIRQLNVAIRLLFSYEDSLAVHTLAYAAYGLLKNESKVRGSRHVLTQLDGDSKQFPKGEFWKRFSELGNALKHPDREALNVPEDFNEALLVTCCMLIREFQPLESAECVALWLWYHALYFINIDEAPQEYLDWVDEHWQELHAEARKDKLAIGLDLYQRLKNTDLTGYRLDPDQSILPWRITFQPSGPPSE